MRLMWTCGTTAFAPSALPLSTHLPTSERWNAKLAVGLGNL